MEKLTSRKNETVRRLRALAADPELRRKEREFLCDGEKLLKEALAHGMAFGTVLWSEDALFSVPCPNQWIVPASLLEYVSPLKHAADVLFTVKMRSSPPPGPPGKTLVLDGVQDPGNLGTILRTANGLGMDTVIFTGACADVYGPKAVRASMGAVFRQKFLELSPAALGEYLRTYGLTLYGAALSSRAVDVRQLDLRSAAVAVGSEGKGLSREILELCAGELLIPMRGDCESLNVSAAAAILMWELTQWKKI